MWKLDKTLAVTASNSAGELLTIKYKILDTDVADRWLSMIVQNQESKHTLKDNYRRILSPEDRLVHFEAFRNNILAINSMYDRKLDDIISLDYLFLNQDLLNDLHKEYEVYGDRLQHLVDVGYFTNAKQFEDLYNPIWPGERQNFELHDRFLRLNEQIHNFESIFRTWNNPKSSLCTCLVDYLPAGIHQDLKPEDYLLFETDMRWGWMYLGYNTLGKHWSSVMNENDIAVVERKQVRPQARFAVEFYMWFGRTNHYTKFKFYEWWVKNDISKIANPDMRLSELALGYIPVAKIISYTINNGAPVAVADKVSANDATEWNLNVWSKFNKIVDVKIINS